MSEKNVVANRSKAYGYNYASLGDIAAQGFTIPKMKTGTDNGREYVYCYDPELKEWIREAEIIIPNMKNMNECQRFGSALTYARRYSVLNFLGLVCDEDKKLEAQEPQKSGIFDEPIPKKGVKELANEFRKVVPADVQERILADLRIDKAEDLGTKNLQKYIEHYGQK